MDAWLKQMDDAVALQDSISRSVSQHLIIQPSPDHGFVGCLEDCVTDASMYQIEYTTRQPEIPLTDPINLNDEQRHAFNIVALHLQQKLSGDTICPL